jgi:hypothetical protein
MKNIIAALILIGGMVVCTVVIIAHQNRQRAEIKREQACREDMEGLDRCEAVAPPYDPIGRRIIMTQCQNYWQPPIAKDCHASAK